MYWSKFVYEKYMLQSAPDAGLFVTEPCTVVTYYRTVSCQFLFVKIQIDIKCWLHVPLALPDSQTTALPCLGTSW